MTTLGIEYPARSIELTLIKGNNAYIEWRREIATVKVIGAITSDKSVS